MWLNSNKWMRERWWQWPLLRAAILPECPQVPGEKSRYAAWARSLRSRWAKNHNLRLVPALQTLLHSTRGKWITTRWVRPVVQLAIQQESNVAVTVKASDPARISQVRVKQVLVNSSILSNFHFPASHSVLTPGTRTIERLFAGSSAIRITAGGIRGGAARTFNVMWPVRKVERLTRIELSRHHDTAGLMQQREKISQLLREQTRRVEERCLLPEMRMQRTPAPPLEISACNRAPAHESSIASARPVTGTQWTGGAAASMPNISQITDEVVRQLDRRFVASRERLGKI